MTETEPLKLLFDRARIESRVAQLGLELTRRLEQGAGRRPPLLVSPLRGAVVFAADLSRALSHPHMLEVVDPVPYARGRRLGARRIAQSFAPKLDVAERDVILVEGIVDTGLTLKFLLDELAQLGPKSLTACVLFDRPPARVVDLPLALVGFTAPDALLVGYGLDHDGLHAHLPDVHALDVASAPRLESAA